jgi:hypothetical protein
VESVLLLVLFDQVCEAVSVTFARREPVPKVTSPALPVMVIPPEPIEY